MLSTERINAHSWWISVFEPLPHERQDLIQKYEVTKELLDYAIDPYEKARVEVDPDAGVTLLIFDVYVPTHEVTAPQTAPIGIMLTNNNLITFTNAKTNFVNGTIANQLKRLQNRDTVVEKLNLVLAVLYRLSTDYFGPLRRVDQKRHVRFIIRVVGSDGGSGRRNRLAAGGGRNSLAGGAAVRRGFRQGFFRQRLFRLGRGAGMAVEKMRRGRERRRDVRSFLCVEQAANPPHQ